MLNNISFFLLKSSNIWFRKYILRWPHKFETLFYHFELAAKLGDFFKFFVAFLKYRNFKKTSGKKSVISKSVGFFQILYILEQSKFKLEKIIGIQKSAGQVRKNIFPQFLAFTKFMNVPVWYLVVHTVLRPLWHFLAIWGEGNLGFGLTSKTMLFSLSNSSVIYVRLSLL